MTSINVIRYANEYSSSNSKFDICLKQPCQIIKKQTKQRSITKWIVRSGPPASAQSISGSSWYHTTELTWERFVCQTWYKAVPSIFMSTVQWMNDSMRNSHIQILYFLATSNQSMHSTSKRICSRLLKKKLNPVKSVRCFKTVWYQITNLTLFSISFLAKM